MNDSPRQTTLKRAVEISGAGLHTGEKSRMGVSPAGPGEGISFIRLGRRIAANAANVLVSARNTSLTDGETTIHTIEHALSALYGLGIDNAVIELDSSEPPAMDGSPLPLCRLLLGAGIAELDEPAEFIEIPEMIFTGKNGAAAFALPADNFHVSFAISYTHPLIPSQTFDSLVTPEIYAAEIAPARTYGFIEEVQALIDAGLSRGASADNAVVIYPHKYSTELRFPNEPARHKAADMIGDLALLGKRVRGHFIGSKSGHALNALLVRKILDAVRGA
jgi:UDP-3-O-acyl N-acetylglucosamine deacetylase